MRTRDGVSGAAAGVIGGYVGTKMMNPVATRLYERRHGTGDRNPARKRMTADGTDLGPTGRLRKCGAAHPMGDPLPPCRCEKANPPP